jgi:nicotinamide-nucleotide amidase
MSFVPSGCAATERAVSTAEHRDLADLVAKIQDALLRRHETVAVAESLTGGLVAAAITERPGASDVFVGSITAYATTIKESLLGVDPLLLAERGAVDADVALAMAEGVRQRMKATYGVATTGVAGPDSQDGQPVGTVFVAVSADTARSVAALTLTGNRREIRTGAVISALELLCRTLPVGDTGNAGIGARSDASTPS